MNMVRAFSMSISSYDSQNNTKHFSLQFLLQIENPHVCEFLSPNRKASDKPSITNNLTRIMSMSFTYNTCLVMSRFESILRSVLRGG